MIFFQKTSNYQSNIKYHRTNQPFCNKHIPPIIIISIFDFVPSITNQNNSIGITDHTRNVQLNKSRFLPKSLLLHEYCKTNHNNSKHTTNYSPPKYPYNTNLISNSLFLNEIENANKKKQPYNLLNTIKHQFKYIHFFYQQILLMLKSVSNLKTIKRNTT